MSGGISAATMLAYASAAVGALGAIQAGKTASNNSKSAANIAEYNAEVANNNAVASRQQAGANEESMRRQASVDLGKQRANIAQTGSGLDTYASSLAAVELDAQNIRYGGELKALGATQEATLQTNSAARNRDNASAAIKGSYLNAGASALSSYSSFSANSRLPLRTG